VPVRYQLAFDASLTRAVLHAREPDRTARVFHRLPPPTDADIAELLTQVHRRVRRLLIRRGRWSEDDPGSDPLAAQEPLFASTVAASLQGRVALGPRAGQPVRRLRSAAAVTTTGRRSAQLAGFSLHADVAVSARRPDQLWSMAGPPLHCGVDRGSPCGQHMPPRRVGVSHFIRSTFRLRSGYRADLLAVQADLSDTKARNRGPGGPLYRETAIWTGAALWNWKDHVDRFGRRNDSTCSGARDGTRGGAKGDGDPVWRCLQVPDVFEPYNKSVRAKAAIVGRPTSGACYWNDPDYSLWARL
jgi:hypothetical protein